MVNISKYHFNLVSLGSEYLSQMDMATLSARIFDCLIRLIFQQSTDVHVIWVIIENTADRRKSWSRNLSTKLRKRQILVPNEELGNICCLSFSNGNSLIRKFYPWTLSVSPWKLILQFFLIFSITQKWGYLKCVIKKLYK